MKQIKFIGLFLVIFSIPAFGKPLPVEYFGQLPDVARVQLAPGGEKISSTIRINVGKTNGMAVEVANLKTGDRKIVLFTDNSKYLIYSTWWKDDKTLLVNTWFPSDRDTWVGLGQARFKTRDTRLLIIDTETGETRSPFSKQFLKKYKVLPTALDWVVDILPDDPDHILMALPGIDNQWASYPIVYKVNIHNQRTSTVKNSEPNIFGWSPDRQHRVRLATYSRDEQRATMVEDIETGKWQQLWPYDIFSENETHAMGFGADPNELYIRAYHNGLLALFKVNLKDKDLKRELVYADPRYDVADGLVYSPRTGEAIGISSSEEGGTVYFDPEMKKLQAVIDKALPNTRNFIYSLSSNESKFMVYSTGPTESGTYYLGQRDPIKLEALAYRYKNLPPQVLAPVERIEYKTRDGLDIEAYLTLPKDVPAKKLPAIMFPHGGPMARDSKAFDYWAQFFASRGYAVLQMNFRGSDGQGFELRNSGMKKWGKEMQDDVEDGAKKLIADGIADADRICIAGASYGGYAALMGVVKTPDFYRCSISVNGVSNVFDLVKDNRAFWKGYNIVDEMIGNDNKELREISPVNHAEKIKVPVLLVHGEMDRQVEIKHSYQMRDALEKAGKKITFIELPDEDHYLTNEANRLTTFKAMDEFLTEHLPVKPQPVAARP